MKKTVVMKNKDVEIAQWILFVVMWIILILFATGCTRTIEILPELCYSDSTGTYMCPKEQDKTMKKKLEQEKILRELKQEKKIEKIA